MSLEIEPAPEKEVEIPQSQLIKLNETADTFWRRFNGTLAPASFIPRAMKQLNTTSHPRWNIPESVGRARWASIPAYLPAVTQASPRETRWT